MLQYKLSKMSPAFIEACLLGGALHFSVQKEYNPLLDRGWLHPTLVTLNDAASRLLKK